MRARPDDAGPVLTIVHTESSCGWGGQEMRVLDECAGLRARGHAVHLVCPAQARILDEAVRRGIPVEPLAIARKAPRGVIALRRWLRELSPQVVNTHSSTDSWLATLAVGTGRMGIPLVRTRHISAPIPRNRATRWLYRRAAHVVTTGETLRRQVIEATGLPEARVSSIPTGVDLARFAPGDRVAARDHLGLPREATIVGIVATLRSWKGHAYLVDAIAAIPDPAVRLLIVGAGPGWAPLHAQVAARGLDARVTFAGQQADVVPWLRAMDVFALPSYANEGVPQALQQAMACGIPIVTTDVGAIREVVEDGVNGVFVQTRDAKALADALGRLIAEGDVRTRYSRAGLRHAHERFSATRMLDRMESVFRHVVRTAGDARRARGGT